MAALTDLFGAENVRTLSVLGPARDSFEVPVHTRSFGNGTGAVQKARFALRVVREAVLWRPDVIHVAHVNLSGLAVATARLSGARTILNTYGLEVWSGLRRDAIFGLRRSEVVIADCHATAEYLMSGANGVARPQVPVIWDCVDLDKFRPGSPATSILARYNLPDPKKHLILMTLGRLSRNAAHKGYERLLHAFARIAPTVPALRLVFAGDGDLRESLLQLAKRLDVSERVAFTGSIDDADLPDVYRAASIFSLVTERGHMRGEGLPLTPLEAMACGVPILVGNQDGSREAVEGGRNGFVLDPLDQQALMCAIVELATNQPLRQRMSAGALAVVAERFSYTAFRDKHLTLYASVVAQQHPRSQRQNVDHAERTMGQPT